jgi:hypothetical protein
VERVDNDSDLEGVRERRFRVGDLEPAGNAFQWEEVPGTAVDGVVVVRELVVGAVETFLSVGVDFD